MLDELVERFEKAFPVSAMARAVLEKAISPQWVDEVFETHRQRQYPRELLFSTVVGLMTLVSIGLRPSLHAAAKQAHSLKVSLAALYDKVRRTEPAVMRALVQGSWQRLAPVVKPMGIKPVLPGWDVRVIDGNHLPASEKRLAPLRELRAAALPGHTLVVYDPDSTLVTDIVACEDAHAQERSVVEPLLSSAQPGQAWIADRNFCTRTIMQGWQDAGACFVVREHQKHPRVILENPWQACGRCETGKVYEQAIVVEEGQAPWRRIKVCLETPTTDEDTEIFLWSNLPAKVGARQIAELYRTRWRIEGMFQRLESVLGSEIKTLGYPRAALLGFAVAVLAYNMLSVLKKSVEHAHRDSQPEVDVSSFFLALLVKDALLTTFVLLPEETFLRWADAPPEELSAYLLRLASRVDPMRVRTHKRGPKKPKPKTYVDGATASSHVSTAKVLKQARGKRP